MTAAFTSSIKAMSTAFLATPGRGRSFKLRAKRTRLEITILLFMLGMTDILKKKMKFYESKV